MITLLNLDKQSKLELPMPNEPGSMLSYWFELGQKMSIEGRQVTSFPVLFGDISGLKDFFNFFIILVIGGSQARMYDYN